MASNMNSSSSTSGHNTSSDGSGIVNVRLSGGSSNSQTLQNDLSISIHNDGHRPSVRLGRNSDTLATVPKQVPKLQHNEIVAETRRVVDSLQRDSDFFKNNPPRGLPSFQKQELNLGEVIGNGQFGIVMEVVGFSLPSDEFVPPMTEMARQTTTNYVEDLDSSEFPTSLNNDECRSFMENHVFREGVARFAIKRARRDVDEARKETSSVDLAVEAKFLASLKHSNIVKMRATVSKPGHDNFMIILDRLYEILDKKIDRWKEEKKSNYGPFGLRVANKVEHFKGKTERLVALYDIARALKHMHSLKLLYRDLKPENIGCDVRGDYKIFDFGLCRELKKCDLREAPDSYACTGLTGSRRWMAPEVVLCRHYGLKADVYSFSLLSWHLITLDLPYEKYDIKKHMAKVVIDGERPNAKRLKSLSHTQQKTIVNGWDSTPSRRPSMDDYCTIIQQELVARKQNVKKNQRRSTVAGIVRRSQMMNDKSSLELGVLNEGGEEEDQS